MPRPVLVLSAEPLNSTLKALRGVSSVPFSLLISDAISFMSQIGENVPRDVALSEEGQGIGS